MPFSMDNGLTWNESECGKISFKTRRPQEKVPRITSSCFVGKGDELVAASVGLNKAQIKIWSVPKRSRGSQIVVEPLFVLPGHGSNDATHLCYSAANCILASCSSSCPTVQSNIKFWTPFTLPRSEQHGRPAEDNGMSPPMFEDDDIL